MSISRNHDNDQHTQLISQVIGLFESKPKRVHDSRVLVDTRVLLDVEFTIKLYPYTFQKYLFGIEMKIGHNRLYIAHQLRELLDHIEHSEAYTFTKHFTYDPNLHRLNMSSYAVIAQLIHMCNDEFMYDELSSVHATRTHLRKDERMMFIPPSAWEVLLPLLVAAPKVQFEQDFHTYHGLQLSDEKLPLRFELDQDGEDAYQLIVEGLDDVVIMDMYGIVLHRGILYKLLPQPCARLLSLRMMLNKSYTNVIHIPKDQIEPFVHKVVPGIQKLGHVVMTKSVSTRIVQPKLKAKLYLDRVKNKLLAGIEFQYGDIVVNPFETANHHHGADHILMRDMDKEGQIVDCIEQAAFTKTEGGYFLEDEAAEYHFLYAIIPQLEKLVQIYATTAVKERLITGHVHPRVRVRLDERTDWLEFRLELEGIPDSEIRRLLQSVEEKRQYYRMPNGALLPLESSEFQEIVRLMNEVGIRTMDLNSSVIRLPIARGVHLMDVDSYGSMLKLDKSFRKLLADMKNPDNMEFPIPVSLDDVLRDYQKYGYQWMKTLAHYRFGGILADDMGLGKTVQSIAYMLSELTAIRNDQLPMLIVCPASLTYNWFNEIKKFAPDIQAVIADGSKSERLRALKQSAHTDVMITSYPLLRMDVEQYAKYKFHTLFLDEAQAFKNHYTQTAQAVKRIQAHHRFALTGTPVENSVEELWSIFDVVFPQLFQERRVFNELSREAVAKRIRPFLLRRLKTDVVQELPDKIETIQASVLLPDQKKLYVTYLAKLRQEALKHLSADDLQNNRIRILAGLTRLRQICCHPTLFVEGYSGSSAKLEQLLQIIEECRSAGKRMLIFSQFTRMLDIIRRELGLLGIPLLYLDGHTPSAERIELCNQFNEGEQEVFLISLKAGGTGLNLTGADTVILYDLWWNPAVEQQATDRAHRIGQNKVVQVIRLVTKGTIEDKMYELQQTKLSLIEEVIEPGQDSLSGLSEQDIRDILMI